MDDASLVGYLARAQAGDPSAVNELVTLYEPVIRLMKLVAEPNKATYFINDRKVHEQMLPDRADPWLALMTWGNLSGGARMVRIKGQPEIPDELDLFIGEVECGLGVGQEVQQIVAECVQRLRDPAGQLRQGVLQIGIGAGLDDRMHGFGLRQVELAGQERPQGEFPWPRGPRAGVQQGTHQEVKERRA